MKITNRILLSILTILMFSVSGTFTASAAKTHTLRLHQFLPAQANVPKYILQKWIDDVEKASDGRIKIQHYPSMQLGGAPPELYDQAVDGVADIIWTVSGYTPGRFTETEVFELPFIMNNAEATSRAYWKYAQNHLVNDEMGDTHVLALWVHGPGIIHSKKPIRKVSDLKGVKLRAPTRPTTLLFKNLGSEPIGMPVPAVPENLSKGVIDATIIPWEVTAALKVSELVKNHTTFPNNSLYTTTFIYTMNKDKYESLPKDLQKVIDDVSGLEFSAFAGKRMQEADAPGLKRAQDLGNNIINLSEKEIKAWKKATQSTIDQWVKEMDSKGYDGKALLKEARSLIANN